MLVLLLDHLSYLLLCTLPLACLVEEPVCLLNFVCCFISKVKSCILSIRSVSCLTTMALCVMSCGVSCAVSCKLFCICCSSDLKLRRGLCSLALALSSSQSSLDQSDGVMEGCGTSNLQYVHPFEVLVKILLGVGLTMSIL